MARLTKTELLNGVSQSLNLGLPSGQALTIAQIRAVIEVTINNALLQLPNVSTAEGFTFETGSDPDNWFDLTLLETGGGGINNEGWQIVPMITGSGINQVNPTAGAAINSLDFDGAPEITAGTGLTENMICTTYGGQLLITGHILAEPAGGQSNRQIEVDIAIYDSAGTLKVLLSIDTSTNSSPAGRANTLNTFSVVLEDPTLIADGDCLALLIRKHEGEPSTTVTIQKCALNLTLLGLRQV